MNARAPSSSSCSFCGEPTPNPVHACDPERQRAWAARPRPPEPRHALVIHRDDDLAQLVLSCRQAWCPCAGEVLVHLGDCAARNTSPDETIAAAIAAGVDCPICAGHRWQLERGLTTRPLAPPEPQRLVLPGILRTLARSSHPSDLFDAGQMLLLARQRPARFLFLLRELLAEESTMPPAARAFWARFIANNAPEVRPGQPPGDPPIVEPVPAYPLSSASSVRSLALALAGAWHGRERAVHTPVHSDDDEESEADDAAEPRP